MRKLILAALLVNSLAQAQVAHTRAPQGDVWGTRDTVTLVDRSGKRVWFVKLPGLSVTDVAVVGEKILVNYLRLTDVKRYSGVMALASPTGKAVWRTAEETEGGSAAGADGWFIRGDKIFMSYTDSGAYMYQGTVIYSLNSGKKVADIGGTFWQEQDGLMLFAPDRPAPALYRPQEFGVMTWNPKTNKIRETEYKIPLRAGCGPFSEEFEDYINEISGPYLIAARRDNCGAFLARVKWTAPSSTKPEIIPLK